MAEVLVIDIEPDWFAIFVDGELEAEGHPYQQDGALDKIVNRNSDVTIERGWFEPDTWQGMPQTLDEAKDLYPNIA